MKIIQHINGVVIDIRNSHKGITMENVALAEEIPAFEPREGFNGVLKYNGNLYWDYEEVQESDELSDSEALDIILGGEVE
jgi:hypothetical protein